MPPITSSSLHWLLIAIAFGAAAILSGWTTNKLRRGGMILLLTFMLGFASLISLAVAIIRLVKWLW